MTTSYILERQEDLKAHKKMMREAEKAAVEKMEEEKELRQAANEARIKAKVERIARGEPAPVKTAVSIEHPQQQRLKSLKKPQSQRLNPKFLLRKNRCKGARRCR